MQMAHTREEKYKATMKSTYKQKEPIKYQDKRMFLFLRTRVQAWDLLESMDGSKLLRQ